MDLEALAVMRAEEQMREGAWKREDRSPDAGPPLNKTHAPADGRCIRWGCKGKVRCKGLCPTHYWQLKSRERGAA